MGEHKNMILAVVLCIAVIFVWEVMFVAPQQERMRAAEEQAQANQPASPAGAPPSGAALPAGTVPGATGDLAATRDEALDRFPRVQIASDRLSGSVSLKGGRIDDLHLTDYKDTQEPDSDTVTLLSPVGAANPFYAAYGWLGNNIQTPNVSTPWTIERGDTIAPDAPVSLVWDNGAGLIFRRTIAVDHSYMFTITQSVENTTDQATTLSPYGFVARHGEPETSNFYIEHEGAIGAFDGTSAEHSYGDMEDFDQDRTEGGRVEKIDASSGWIGFTDKYWMATLVPNSDQPFTGAFKQWNQGGLPIFQTDMRLPAMNVGAGQSISIESRLFAGAKEVATIRDYQEQLSIDRFDYAVDWGWFWFLTRPIFDLLSWVKGFVGNMGWSIIALTFLIKAALFPLAYKSYVSMSKMKKLQPEMEKLKERCGDDKQKMQQEMIALYKKEKVNPAAGCLPILLQIPIFFSLYKVFFVTIEMRHAPFIAWITDLSAPDPTSILNLFGLLPFAAPGPESFVSILSIGVFPILMGVTMWMQQKLNPAPTDPMQQKIFAWMPWVFMFMLGQFASGLVIYWCANNILTFTQQYLIMRSQGVDVDFLGNVTQSFRRKKDAPPEPEPEPKQVAVDKDDTEDKDPTDEPPAKGPRPKPAAKTRKSRKKR